MLSTIDGTVLRANGTPAAFVGVVPMSLPTGDHSRPHELGIVATTDAAGHFRVRDYGLSGFRILMGPRSHETWIDRRYDPGRSQQLIITLPPIGDEQHNVFIRERRDFGDPQGVWIRGRVLRAGRPVADVHVTFTTGGNMPLDDSTRSRNDGSFELYISAREIDRCQPVVLYAGDSAQRLGGLAVVEIAPGNAIEGVMVEVGSGVHVTGTVVDEDGQPVQGVRINETWRGLESTPTDRDGWFDLTIYRQGRYRLRVLDDAHIELLPPEGRLSPTIDIATPDGARDDVRVVVRRNAKVQRESRSWAGFDGYVDLGASIGHSDVRAVDNELEAAGLRAGDTIIATDPPRESYEFWSAQILEGEQTTLTVLRDGKQLEIHATAPYFGSAEPRVCR
jgi:hypothetical protein